MRLFEVLLVLVWLVPLVMGRFRRVGRGESLGWSAAAVALAAVHIFVEQPRWPMTLVYAGVLGSALWALAMWKRPFRPKKPRRWWHWVGLTFAGLSIALSVSVPLLVPIPAMPTPTGPYAVGTQTFEWVDVSRPEIYSETPDDHRDLIVRVWYPAVSGAGVRDHGWRDIGLVLSPLEQYSLTPQHSFSEAPWASGAFPLLLFSPGYGMAVSANTVQMEDLASHGYVVASIGHPYQNPLSYPDGRVIPSLDENKWLKLTPAQIAAYDAEGLKDLERLKTADDSETRVIFESIQKRWPFGRTNVQIWTDDSRFVLDQLASQLGNHLNLEQVGAFGHSFGGATAGVLLLQEPRIKAGANLDGWQYGFDFGQELKNPFLLMSQADLVTGKVNDVLYSKASPFWQIRVKNSLHMDFCDLGLLTPLVAMVGNVGWVDRPSVESLINRSLRIFFDAALKRERPGLPKAAQDDQVSTLTYRE